MGLFLNWFIEANQLDQLKAALDEKHPKWVKRKCIVFHQWSTRSHASLMTRQKLLQLDWEVLIHCFDYCSFVISSEVKFCAFSFVLFPQALAAILFFFWFHINFRVIYSSLVKNVIHNLVGITLMDKFFELYELSKFTQKKILGWPKLSFSFLSRNKSQFTFSPITLLNEVLTNLFHDLLPFFRQLHNSIFPNFLSFWSKNSFRCLLRYFRELEIFFPLREFCKDWNKWTSKGEMYGKYGRWVSTSQTNYNNFSLVIKETCGLVLSWGKMIHFLLTNFGCFPLSAAFSWSNWFASKWGSMESFEQWSLMIHV